MVWFTASTVMVNVLLAPCAKSSVVEAMVISLVPLFSALSVLPLTEMIEGADEVMLMVRLSAVVAVTVTVCPGVMMWGNADIEVKTSYMVANCCNRGHWPSVSFHVSALKPMPV